MGVLTQEAAEQAPLGFAESQVEADGFRIRVVEKGSGEPLVFFHGSGGLRVTPAHAALADRRRVIMLEAPGFGRSPVNQRTRDMAELARTMLGAARAMELASFDLMGQSFGAKLALWTAIQSPEAVRALVLVAPSAIRPEDWAPAAPESSDEIEHKQQKLAARLFGQPVDDALQGRMGEIACPVLALFGTRDELIPTSYARRYRRLMPRAHIMFVYDAGHRILEDRPEAAASLIEDFLEEPGGFLVNRISGKLSD
jgi:pimeloyl-ACP methyl ester carboxylesterase